MFNLLLVPRKMFGWVWFWFVLPFRHYARHVVHLYKLQNNDLIKRQMERNPKYKVDRWILPIGYILDDRKISKIEYLLVKYLIWGWLDDDAYCDTFSAGHNETYLNGERKLLGIIPLNNRIGKWLLKGRQCEKECGGSIWAIGDIRKGEPCFNLLGTMIWNIRNSAYNFEYEAVWKTEEQIKVWYVKIFGMEFGWKKVDMCCGKQWYKMVFIKDF